jgi:invasion protein IalB
MNKLTERLVVGGAALVVGLVLGWMIRGVATYSPTTETVTAYQDWRTACPPVGEKTVAPCEMIEDVQDDKTHSTVARVAITRDGAKQMIGFTMPFGVALEAGVGLRIGKDPVKVIQYRTCNQIGCIAVAPLDDKLATSLKSATDAQLLFAGLDGKPVGVAISMKGYNDAHRAYASNESKRANWFWRLWS